MNDLLTTLILVGIYGAFGAGMLYLRTRSENPSSASQNTLRVPRATLILVVAIAIPTTFQIFFPSLLAQFQRDTMQILQGQVWRIVTALFFQDGGIVGGLFNLFALLLVGTVAEQLWDTQFIFLIFFLGGIAGELVGLVWQPIGAGNSVGNFSLAASIIVACLLYRSSRLVQIIALIPLAAFLGLAVSQDIHGAAAVTSLVLAFVLSGRGIRQTQNHTA